LALVVFGAIECPPSFCALKKYINFACYGYQ